MSVAYGLVRGVLAGVVPPLVWVAVALGLARVNARLGNPRGAERWSLVALLGGVAATVALLVVAWAAPDPAELPPPVVQLDGLLVQCIKDGGVQMAHLDGRWVCITPDVAG